MWCVKNKTFPGDVLWTRVEIQLDNISGHSIFNEIITCLEAKTFIAKQKCETLIKTVIILMIASNLQSNLKRFFLRMSFGQVCVYLVGKRLSVYLKAF